MLRAVIFDLDGTLADTIQDIAAALRDVTGTAIEEDVVRRSIGKGVKVLLQKVYAHYGIETEDIDADVRRYSSVYAAGSGQRSTVNPGVTEYLEWLRERGIHTAVATMKPRGATDKFMDTMGLSRYFDIVITGDDMMRPKPDGWCVEEICRRFGIEPAEALMVGDGMTDIGAGKNAGARTAAVLGGYYDQDAMRASGADYIIENMAELVGAEV